MLDSEIAIALRNPEMDIFIDFWASFLRGPKQGTKIEHKLFFSDFGFPGFEAHTELFPSWR